MPNSQCPVVIDLRAPHLLALANVGYKGRTLAAATIGELVEGDARLVAVLVATKADEIAVAWALPQSIRCVTRQQLDSVLEDAPAGQPLVWLTSLVPGLSAEDIGHAIVEHSDHVRAGWDGTCSLLRGSGEQSPAQVAGWILDTTRLGGARGAALAVESPLALDVRSLLPFSRPAFCDLDGWSAFISEERRMQAEQLLGQGVRLDDWKSLQINGEVDGAARVTIAAHVIFEGRVVLGEGVAVGPYTYLRDVTVGPNTEIKAFSVLEDVRIGEDCRIGPYARLRGHTTLERGVSIGNFVELKATNVGIGGRINHMAFLGDADLGPNVTIGAGVITCNHDGEKAAGTKIEEGAYVGSGTQLVAPLVLGKDATIAAGSTITESVEPGGLTIARSRQVRIDRWLRWGKK